MVIRRFEDLVEMKISIKQLRVISSWGHTIRAIIAIIAIILTDVIDT